MRVGKSLLLHACVVSLTSCGASNAADFSPQELRDGLGKLAALLATDVPRTARWVLVSNDQGRFGIFTREEDVFTSEGNAFVFDEKPGKEARIMVMYDGGIYPVKSEEQAPQDVDRRRDFHASWKDADVAKDVVTAIDWLKKQAKDARSSSNSGGRDLFSANGEDSAANFKVIQQTAISWAAILWHIGQEAPAVSLATAALEGTDEAGRGKLLDAIFTRSANQAYSMAMKDFGEHRDWAKLRDALDVLVKKFPLGWEQRDAVRVFHHQVTERAKLSAEPSLKTKAALGAEDQRTLLGWLKELEGGKRSPYGIWSLPLPQEQRGGTETETAFPRSVGLAAVPLLAALLADDTLTLVSTGGGRGGYGEQFWDIGGDEEDRLRNFYKSLQKPPTRANLAWATLREVLPQELRNVQDEDLADVIPDILAWHASVKNASVAELAITYIESGQRNESVLAHAIETDDPKHLTRLEGAMLENVNIWDLSGLDPFVTKLGKQRGHSFLNKVRQKLEGDLVRYQSDAKEEARQRKQMDSALKRLEAAAAGEKKTLDLPALLAIAAKFDPQVAGDDQLEFQDAFQQIPKVMEKLAASTRIESIAKVLPDFKSPQFAAQMLEFVFDGDRQQLPALKPEEHKAVLEATKPHWQKILETEPTDDNRSLQAQVLVRLQELAGIKEDFPFFQLLPLGDRGSRIIRERGLAILGGQTPAAMPHPKDIGKEQREKLFAEWAAKSPADIAAGLETLELDKLLALNDEILRFTNQRGQNLPAGLQTHIDSIHEIKTKDTEAAPWQSWKGKIFNKDALLALAREISATKTNGMLTVSLHRAGPLLGLTLHVSESPTIRGWQSRYLTDLGSDAEMIPPSAQRFTMSIWQQQRHSEEWGWFDAPAFHEAKALTEPKNEAEEAMQELDEEARSTWQNVTAAFDKPSSAQINLHIFTVPVSLLKAEE